MPTGQIGANNSSDSDSSDSDTDEMPFLARSSAEATQPKSGPEPAGTKEGRHSHERHRKEVMEIPEAVEAVTGVNASYLPVQHFSCLLAFLLLTQVVGSTLTFALLLARGNLLQGCSPNLAPFPACACYPVHALVKSNSPATT